MPRALHGLTLLAALSFAGAAAAEEREFAVAYERPLQVPVTAKRLAQPLAVHVDAHTGEIFVADSRKNLIAIFDPEGVFRFAIPGGTVFRGPMDLATEPDGHILVLAHLDGGRGLVRLDFDGRDPEWLEITGLPEDAVAPHLTSIALSADGTRLYLLDEANHRLWIADGRGAIRDEIDLAAGYDADQRGEQILDQVDVYGDTVLVALPMEGKIQLFDLDGTARESIGLKGGSKCETAFPVAGALDEEGHVLLLDQQRALIMRWRRADNRCLGEYSGIGSSAGRLYKPADLALDGAGRIYIGQGFEGRVQRFGGALPAAGAAEAEKLRR